MREDCPTSPPDCLDDDTVAGFVDGNLAASERARVERVIDVCATCRRQVSEVIRLRQPPTDAAPERIGRYEVRGVLGRGGMGIVLRAWDPQLEREVALKLVREGDTLRLVREARAMAKLRHASVLAVYDVTIEGGQLCVVMELVDGGNLAEWFATRPPWREVLARCVLAGHGLIAAHDAGLIHRDFKPANVLCARDGRVLVADFGLARTSPGVTDAASALTGANALAGTPAYMAPEQLLGETIGPAADQFAFAATLYEGLFGVRPFGGTTVAAVIAEIVAGKVRKPAATEIPAPIVAAVLRGLARAPGDRWPSLRAMLDALAVEPRTRWLPIAGAATVAAIGVVAWVVMRAPAVGASQDAQLAALASTPAATDARSLAPVVTDAHAMASDRATRAPDAGRSPTGPAPDAALQPRALPSVDAARPFDLLGDRGPFEAAARAWAPDAKLRSLQATELDVNGTVDLEHGIVEYVFVSRAREASDPSHCAFALNIQHGVVAAVRGERGCDVGGELGPPRCTLAQVWTVAERSDADPKETAAVSFSDGRWEFAQGTIRIPIVDACR